MRILAIVKRIIQQFRRDKRSITMMMVAPLLVMTLLWIVLDMDEYDPAIAVNQLPAPMQEALEKQNATIVETGKSHALELMQNQELDAYLSFQKNEATLIMEGSEPSAASAVQRAVSEAVTSINPKAPAMDVEFLHGSADLNLFDNTGAVLIGFFVFFFVFIIGGVSFLRERTQGTLERLLATPLKRWEIVVGYLLGFGIFIIIQSAIVAAFSIYVLDIYLAGSFISVLVIAFLLAISALSLGTLLSAYAKNEFQMIQFIPVVIVPQVFFSGVFPIDSVDWIDAISKVMPLTYGAEALQAIMIRGETLIDVLPQMASLAGFSLAFIILNILALKRHRAL